VTLATGSRSGEFSRAISVQTNDAEHPQVALTCKARALVAIKADPMQVNFGRIARDAGPQTRTITITRGDGGPISPELVPSKDTAVSAKLREIEPGERYELDVTVAPPWGNDRLSGAVAIKTGLPEAPVETIRVYGQVDPRLRAEPGNFTLPQELAEQMELRARLRWSGEPAKVLGVSTSDPDLTVRLEEENGEQAVVLVAPAGYHRKAASGAYVVVTTDDEAIPALRIPIRSQAPRPRAGAKVESAAAAPPATQPGDQPGPVYMRVEKAPPKAAPGSQPTR